MRATVSVRRLGYVLALALPLGLLATFMPGSTHVAIRPADSSTATVGDVVFSKVSGTTLSLVLQKGSNGSQVTLRASSEDLQFPDVSADGTQVVYVDDLNGGGAAIDTINIDGSDNTALTTPDLSSPDQSLHFFDNFPRWSPNGSKIVFDRQLTGSGTIHIMVMNSDGTGLQDLTPSDSSGTIDETPTWSPSGTQIAYSRSVGPSTQATLWVMNADGSDAHQVSPSGPCDAYSPTWSADGSRIYYQEYCGGITTLAYLTSTDSFANATDTTLVPVSEFPFSEFMITGDGVNVLYDNDDNIYWLDTATGVTTQLTNDTGSANDTEPAPVWPTWSSTTATPSPSPTPSTSSIPAPFGYAALGDSYSSGEGNTPFIPDSVVPGDHCDRSLAAYSEHLTAVPASAAFEFAACSGATTADITGPNAANNEPAQVSVLSDETSLVTITIGGDDLNFAGILAECITGLKPCNVVLGKSVPAAIKSLEPKLVSTYAAIHAAAPNALIVVGGYPQLFAANPVKNCTGIIGLSVGERAWLDSMAVLLDASIQNAVSQEKQAGAHIFFAPVVGAVPGTFTGHEICSSGTNTYLRGESPLLHKEYWFHPNSAGQLAYAAAFDAAITSAK